MLETTAGICRQTLPGEVQVPAFVVETTLRLHGFVTQPRNCGNLTLGKTSVRLG